jgi:probable F420-dependent oxidoreductase
MKFGLNVVPIHPHELGDLTVRAEALGFESVWVGQHAVTPLTLSGDYPGGKPPFDPKSRFLDPFTTLAYLAGITDRMRLGTGILILPLHEPVLLARAIATVDVLSGGRVSVGIGVGWMREEFEAVGQRYEERGRRTDEMVEVLDTLFSEEEPSFHGRYFRLPPMGFAPKPAQRPRPPVLVGGGSPAALRRAARIGDGWYGTQDPPEQMAQTVATMRSLREEYGRGDVPFEITAMTAWGKTFDADLVAGYAKAGVDRLVVTPWQRSSEAGQAIDRFAADAGLTG